ncbi:MAG: PQQ-dependent sugar dehydrogenase [Acidobacteriota bacterium]|nr:PQQ-dependent sugar dehydrogenase [Blastocatellia bacterium]MDW8411606.1 PQQ-dependent sugar dehydrogenase [Acidobacteriota bacterium]
MGCAGAVELQSEHQSQQPPFRLVQMLSGLRSPVYLTHAGDGSGRLFIVEQSGRVLIYKSGRILDRPFLDITSLVSFGGERGLLSIAFHPKYKENGRYFVNYTRFGDGATIIAEYRVSSDPDVSLTDGRVVMTIPQPFSNHNGGQLQFGPDGYLYIGMGDGGGAGDPLRAGQNLETLLGKMLRIDVDQGLPYSIPADNPFFGSIPGLDEIYALGLRNPWRFSFDRKTGELYAADVGQNRLEEVDLIVKGGNYGWNIMEGSLCFSPMTDCNKTGLILPIAEYGRDVGCSITGGYVYRGKKIPELDGVYLYSDYCSGVMLGYKSGNVTQYMRTGYRVSSFGEDEDGELYVLDYRGTIYKIEPVSNPCLLTCPQDITVKDSDGDGRERVDFPPPSLEGDCGEVVYTFASGTEFPVGTTKVEAFSSRGNGRCSFNVTVLPAEVCVLTCPSDVTVTDADGDGFEVVSYPMPSAKGNCGQVTLDEPIGRRFPIGVTEVVAKSSVGNGRCSFKVTVLPADKEPPKVRVVSPNGGEKYRAGSQLTITWQASDNVAVASQKIFISVDGGQNFVLLAASLAAEVRSFVYEIPASQKKTKLARVRVEVVDAAGNSAFDDSDSDFTIRKKN